EDRQSCLSGQTRLSVLHSEQVFLCRDRRSLSAIFGAELVENRGHVELRGALADAQLGGDLFVRFSSGDEAKNFALPRAEAPARSDQPRGDAGIDVRIAAGNSSDGALD